MDFLRKNFSLWDLHVALSFFSISDPDYCTRYYRCAHGVDQGFECPRGTAWDEETKSCAWIEQVNCDQKKADYSTSTSTEGMKFFFKSIVLLFIDYFISILLRFRYNNITKKIRNRIGIKCTINAITNTWKRQ